MKNIIVTIVEIFQKKRHQGKTIIYGNVIILFWILFFHLTYIFSRYWLRLEISDYTTSTTCTIFDDEAKRMIGKSIFNLLESNEGNTEDVPKIIQQLYGKVFIFQFKLNSQNLTEGRQGYLVRRAFIPDEKLEKEFLHGENNGVIQHDEVIPDVKVEKELLHDNKVS
jgi:hypothetical protein